MVSSIDLRKRQRPSWARTGQNRNDIAVQLKLDELLRAVETARTGLVDLENSTDEEIEKLRREFRRLHDESADVKP